jgi:Bacterial Ig-like domain (group 3)
MVTAGSGSPAGTVKFLDGATQVGTTQTLVAGSAAVTTSALAAGSHSLTVQFVPSDPTAFSGSTSTAVVFVVTTPAAISTSTTLTVTPASPQVSGTSVTLTAAVSATAGSPVGSVKFFDGATQVGGTQPLVAGAAAVSTSALSVGSHSLTAQFVPANPTAFSGSTSSPSTFVITSPTGARPTVTVLSVKPSSQIQGKWVTLIAQVSVADKTHPRGGVTFYDGTTRIGHAHVRHNGLATMWVRKLSVGSHELTAVFSPRYLAKWAPSTSDPVSLLITPKKPHSTGGGGRGGEGRSGDFRTSTGLRVQTASFTTTLPANGATASFTDRSPARSSAFMGTRNAELILGGFVAIMLAACAFVVRRRRS